MVVSLTFYGGVNEIGGNKVLLRSGDVKVFLDFGMSFALRKQFYSDPFLSPRRREDLLEFGILPDLRGIYRPEGAEPPQVDAVFLSHAHMDHAAYISFLRKDIPVYCGETTETILKALGDTKVGLEYDISDIRFKTFRTGDKIRIGDLKVEPIHVDHSIPGAYGFILHTPSGAVVYTGDLRLHGTKPEMTEEFVQKAAEAEPVAVIPEGTNMVNAEISSEPEVGEKISRIIGQVSGLVLADFAWADVDRLRSFYQAAKLNKRRLAVTLKQAYLLNKLSTDPHLKIPSLKDENMLVFQRTKKRYYSWEREILESSNVVNYSQVAEMQGRVVLAISFYGLGELIGIKPAPESCYILSASEPFNEEMEIDFNRLMNWLDHYGLPQYHVHISGHIMPLQLKEALKTMKPKKIFPIHGEHPELFGKFMKNLPSEIILPEKGKEYTL